MPYRIDSYEQAFDTLGIALTDKVREKLKKLEKEGHTEKSICFSVWKSQGKLLVYKNDSRFWSIFVNEVNKWSWKKNDPRWNDYWKEKNEIKRASELRQQINKTIKLDNKSPADKKYNGSVYFIQGENGGAIKIGFTKDISARMKNLQTGYPDKLKLLKIIPGDELKEQKIHEELEGYKLKGEWFKPHKFVIDKIKSYE